MIENSLNDEDLKTGYWIVTHKIFFKRLGYSFFILFNSFLIIFSGYKIINHFGNGAKIHNKYMDEFFSAQPNYELLHQQRKPGDLIVNKTLVLKNGQNSQADTYDLAAEIYNPSKKHITHFTYQFILNDMPLDEQRSYLLPGETKIIAEYARKIQNKTKNIQIALKNQSFQNVSNKKTANPINFIQERVNFIAKDVKVASLSKNNDFYKISFDITNETPYNYWEVNLTTSLFKQKNIIGINHIVLEKFRAGEVRTIDVNWYDYLPSSTQISITPEVNVFNPNSYMGFEGEQSGLIPKSFGP